MKKISIQIHKVPIPLSANRGADVCFEPHCEICGDVCGASASCSCPTCVRGCLLLPCCLSNVCQRLLTSTLLFVERVSEVAYFYLVVCPTCVGGCLLLPCCLSNLCQRMLTSTLLFVQRVSEVAYFYLVVCPTCVRGCLLLPCCLSNVCQRLLTSTLFLQRVCQRLLTSTLLFVQRVSEVAYFYLVQC